MYCPLNDGHVVSQIQSFIQGMFQQKVPLFLPKYGIVLLQGTNDFQKLICSLPVIQINPSNILSFDKVVVDYDHREMLDEFWKKNKMQLQKPVVQESTEREIFLVAVALMELKAMWNAKHNATKHLYDISAIDSYNEKILNIAGYMLGKVNIALKDDIEVSARIDLGDDITITLSDVTAFGKKNLHINDQKSLYKLVTANDMQYYQKGTLIAPCIEEELLISNHLQGINWQSEDTLYQVHVESSEALTKLKLNEKGVEARAETFASTRMLLGASASHHQRSYSLTIKHGLVVDIRYRNQSIFVAYVPQERFITK